jgi:glycerol-3-phosphate dehydrogenase
VALLERAKLPTARKMRLVRGSHIVVRRLFDHDHAYFFQLRDKRVFFVIPYERDFTLIGTTDRDHEGTPDKVEASGEEIDYLCAGANEYLAAQIGPADVLWTFSGVRPLVDDGSGKPEAATRGYGFELSGGYGAPPLLSVFGGKITTYRHLAAEAMDRLAPLLPVLAAKDWTAEAPLPGGDFETDALPDLLETHARDYPFLEDQWIDRIVRAYGTRARLWLAGAASLDALGAHFGHGLTAAEVDYLMDREWARTADDVLWRRTKLGLRLDAAQVAALTRYMNGRSGAQ